MRHSILRFAALLALAGCVAASPPTEAGPLAGAYRVVAVDGREPQFVEEDVGTPRTPRFAFSMRGYGGTSGCNFMGGLKVQRGDRLFTYPGPQTQMACMGALGEQERAIDVLFRAAPTIAVDGEAVILSGGGHSMRLEPDRDAAVPRDPPEAWQGARLDGQRFALRMLDGEWRTTRREVTLAFSSGQVTVAGDCSSPMRGRFTERSGGLTVEALEPACPADRALATALSGVLSTVSGPNGELLIAGDGGWAAVDNLRRHRPK